MKRLWYFLFTVLHSQRSWNWWKSGKFSTHQSARPPSPQTLWAYRIQILSTRNHTNAIKEVSDVYFSVHANFKFHIFHIIHHFTTSSTHTHTPFFPPIRPLSSESFLEYNLNESTHSGNSGTKHSTLKLDSRNEIKIMEKEEAAGKFVKKMKMWKISPGLRGFHILLL